MVGVKEGLARSRPFTVMLVEHAKGAWHVSTGSARWSNARHAAQLCWRRWDLETRAEWPGLFRLCALAAAPWRRVANRRTRAA
jgi:hypothetical protein